MSLSPYSFGAAALRRSFLFVVIASVGFAGVPSEQAHVNDPRCPPSSCCAESTPEAAIRPGCFVHALWTFAYCCPREPTADCYRWGEDAPGHDLAVHMAVSGVQCRHLCQSHEDCAYWTYMADAAELPDSLRGHCYLKAQGALQDRVVSHPFVVSGERVCKNFGEGLSRDEARARRGLEIVAVGGAIIPWRTAAGKATADASRANLLPLAGTEQWHLEAAELVKKLGFVVVVDALNPAQILKLRRSAEAISQELLSLDDNRIGNRGPRRYSYGGASQTLHMLHVPAWAELVDNDAVNAVLPGVFPQGYLAVGGGGDFVLGGTSTYQSLHLDVGGGPIYDLGVPPAIGVNFVVEDLTCAEAPLRMIPNTHTALEDPPSLLHESQEMKDAVLCPLPAGSAIIRDLRGWHGGTPSGSDRSRNMPNAEYVSLEWGRLTCGSGEILDPCQPVLPQLAYDQMSERGRAIAAGLVDRSGAIEEMAKSGEWLRKDFAHYERHQAYMF